METTIVRASATGALSLLPRSIRRFVALSLAGALLVTGVVGVAGGFGASFVSAAAQCTPNSSYSLPSPVDLTLYPAGLTVIDDGTSYYDVSGRDRPTIAAGLNECAPRFDGIATDTTYLAYTSYNLSWQYGVNAIGDGTCRLSDVKVGLRLSQIYPRLTTVDAPNPITKKWNAFIAGTQEHENGHLQIDKDLASNLLDDLNSLYAPCSSIDATVSTVTAKYSKLYNADNHEHDVETDYGNTQGATW